MARRGKGSGWGGPSTGYGWGGPANGPGWGGPARGIGHNSRQAEEFVQGNAAAAGPHDMRRSKQKEAMLNFLYDLALTSDNGMTQVHAATAWLNQVEGKPRPMVLASPGADLAGLDDAALDAETVRLQRELDIVR